MIEKTTNTHRFGKLLMLAHPDSVGLKAAVFDWKSAYS
jgi:hypothetical protein